MTIEPKEIRIHRTPRSEAVRRAARLLGEAEKAEKDNPADDQSPAAGPAQRSVSPAQVDEAFASLSADPAALRPASNDLVTQIASQLQQLDAQRDRLANLLAGIDRS